MLIFPQGYFLLHHLAMMVGLEEFDAFLFNYVQHYKGQLVSSEVSFSVTSDSQTPLIRTNRLIRTPR